jgi:ribosomal protein S18 acetylase RimI-like enzyme
MADLVIRDARPHDLDVIIDYNARLALETENKELDPDVLRRGVSIALGDPDRLRYWVAEDETGQVVGQAAITREWSDWRSGWIWWFQSVYVHPDFRGQGAFRTLYAQVRAIARASPEVIGLRLYVEVHNERAQGVYRSLGMKPGGYDVYEDLWIGRSFP